MKRPRLRERLTTDTASCRRPSPGGIRVGSYLLTQFRSLGKKLNSNKSNRFCVQVLVVFQVIEWSLL